MSYGNPNRHTDCEQFIDPTQPTIGEDVAMLVLTLQRDCDALRAQNAELLAALRRVLKAHEAILRDPSKSSTCIDTRSLIARIEAAP